MKALGMVRWAGLAATVGGMFMVFSDLLNLTIYVPGLGEAAHTGYQAVGSGVILLALTLLFVGMVGLFAGSPRADGPKVIEYGDAHARYVLAEFEPLRPEVTGTRNHARSAGEAGAARGHRAPVPRGARSLDGSAAPLPLDELPDLRSQPVSLADLGEDLHGPLELGHGLFLAARRVQQVRQVVAEGRLPVPVAEPGA